MPDYRRPQGDGHRPTVGRVNDDLVAQRAAQPQSSATAGVVRSPNGFTVRAKKQKAAPLLPWQRQSVPNLYPGTLTPAGVVPTHTEIEDAIVAAYPNNVIPRTGDIVVFEQFHYLVFKDYDTDSSPGTNGIFLVQFHLTIDTLAGPGGSPAASTYDIDCWAMQIGPNRLY